MKVAKDSVAILSYPTKNVFPKKQMTIYNPKYVRSLVLHAKLPDVGELESWQLKVALRWILIAYTFLPARDCFLWATNDFEES